MPDIDTAKYISDASKTIYFTYIDGESVQVQASLLLTLVINTIEQSGQKDSMIDAVKRGLTSYENTDDIMDLANGNLN